MKMKAAKVSQHKLRRYLELEPLVAEFKQLKDELKASAMAGAEVQTGPIAMQLSTKKGRRTPAWKGELIDLADRFIDQMDEVSGELYAQSIMDNTKPGAASQSLAVIDRRQVLVE